MGVLGIVLIVVFCIIALLLLFLITIQGQDSAGLGSVFGGKSDSAFGSGTNSFLTKITAILAVVFMVLSLVVALVNKSSSDEIAQMTKTRIEQSVFDTAATETESVESTTSN